MKVKNILFQDLLAFSYGASCGWPSASIPILKSDDTPLESGPITASEASWIASGICLGGFVGNLVIGWVKTKALLNEVETFSENLRFYLACRSNWTKSFTVHRCVSANSKLGFNLLR